jgi:UDP-N-acetylmuramoyl-tripeptide--D-alanyl-D-alanine ligase
MQNTIELILSLVAVFIFLVYAGFKAKREVHMMQQNSYFISRYWQWWTSNVKLAFGPLEVLGLLVGVVSFFLGEKNIASVTFILIFVIAAYRFYKHKPKKALVFTPRAKRLFGVMLGLNILAVLGFYFFNINLLLGLPLLALLSFIVLILASAILLPIENGINQGFVNDAKNRLRSMPNLKVIGITGSYGKTSVKHFVARILAEKYNVLHTPGSVNTTLGVVRIVREQLKPTHDIFIAEMGAKKMGDVAEICDLVQPTIAILTAIGPEHLDTFGTIENVQQGNFELPKSIKASGLNILNADYELVRAYDGDNGKKIFYGIDDKNSDYAAENLEYTANGMSFDFLKKGEKIQTLETRLLGAHNISNIVAACAVAYELEVEPAKIAYAVRNLQPVQHRLEIKRNPGGVTIIDDAFNSNPTGARMAVEVLGKVQGNQKIIVTPGMIELADEEYAYNKAFGKQIAAVCDYVVLVGPKQTIPIQDGLREAGYPESKLYVAKNLTDATTHLRGIAKIGDVVLYENDLPDTYNE